MRNWLLAGLLCLLMPFGAMAASETINFGDLDDAAIAELKLQIEQRKQQHAADPTTTAQTVSEYTLVGQQVAQAVIGVASELGQEVDEVMATTTGKLILAVVLWKVIGTDLVQLIAGFMWFVIFLPLWWRMFRRYGENYEEKYEDGKLVSRRNGKTSVEAAWTFGIALIIIVGGGLILTFV